MKITEEDVGRVVKLRNGGTATIRKVDPDVFFYPVKGSADFSWTSTGRYHDDGPSCEYDIVGFVTEEGQAMKITRDDIGRVVKLRNGKTRSITKIDLGEPIYPVRGSANLSWTTTGESDIHDPSCEYDIIGFVTEEDQAMEITEEDVGRVVKLRNGETRTITGFAPHGTPYKVRSGLSAWTPTGEYDIYASSGEYDIVGFVTEEGQAMKITEADVGRRARLRNGDTATIVKFRAGKSFPVENALGNTWTDAGQFGLFGHHEGDIIGFVDEEETKAFEIAEADVGKFVKLRDGRTARIVGWDGSGVPVRVRIGGAGLGINLWCESNGKCLGIPNLDIVGFVDEEDAASRPAWFTEADVGQVVKLRNGKFAVVMETDQSCVPILLSNDWWVNENGAHHANPELDVVEKLPVKVASPGSVKRFLATINYYGDRNDD